MVAPDKSTETPVTRPSPSVRETEIAIKTVKDFFEMRLAETLNLIKVSAPMFVDQESGVNDNLSGVERPVEFEAKSIPGALEIVHSLAKWKRVALGRYGFVAGEGLYTDMKAIRRDEDLDNLHSIYVDQWDWEKVIGREERNQAYLQQTVCQVYGVLRATEAHLCEAFPRLRAQLPPEIAFITTQQLADRYPTLSPKLRENAIARELGAVFLMQIGDVLLSGEKHDDRAPDYDDWSLNGDILVWYPVLQQALELSSMGIRVDAQTLARQLAATGREEQQRLTYHRRVLSGQLPLTIGGGIGQSRVCMFLLQKAHIGEVQASVWPEEMLRQCEAASITLL
ncbi:MAG: aspartate--ammonia ligase [Bacillota bacterium]